MLKKISSIVLALGLVAAVSAAPKIIGYFPYWAQYSQFYPKDIRYDFVTDIHYVGFSASEDASIAATDGSDLPNFESLAQDCKTKGVGLMVTLGGAENASVLAAIASDDALRATLVKNTVQFVKRYNLAGIELDWTPEESQKGAYTSLMTDYSSAFSQESPKILLAATLPWNETNAVGFNMDALQTADYLTVQAIDLMDAEQSTVIANAGATSSRKALEMWMAKGISASKLVIVVPFYGRSFAGATGLNSSHQGVGSGNDGVLGYKELMEKFDGDSYKVSFDEESQSEVAVSKDEAIVFNGIPSTKASAELVQSLGLAGIAAYDLANDHPQPIVSLLVTMGKVLRPEVNYKAKKR